VGDKSSSVITALLPNNVMSSTLNETVTTTESGSNVASVFPKSSVNKIPVVAMNPEDHSVGDKISCLGSPFSPSTVMPTKHDETVTAIESCMNVNSLVPESNVNSICAVGMHTKISTIGEHSSSWGTPFFQAKLNSII